MFYLDTYDSPVGMLTLAASEGYLNGLWTEGQKYFEEKLATRVGDWDAQTSSYVSGECARKNSPALQAGHAWLDAYFAGRDPGMLPPYKLHGTPFQEQVWQQIAQIPYGTLITYGDIAHAIAPLRPAGRASARAVGVAVGCNPLSIIVPCHRVVGSTGSLTGYSGGIDRKKYLLALEGIDPSKLHTPTRGTAL